MEPIEPANAVSRLLALHRGGAVLQELDQAVRAAVAAATEAGKVANVRLDIEIKPAAKDAFAVAIVVTPKLPRKAPEPAMYYADDDHNLRRDNPRQATMDLRAIEPPAPPVTTANPQVAS